ncbi:MAG: hypothetical protein J0L93_11155 [Deltaproteobacteria bacterium]|nr:hypothetical protein [Deltaproteobacteria bacterium]
MKNIENKMNKLPKQIALTLITALGLSGCAQQLPLGFAPGLSSSPSGTSGPGGTGGTPVALRQVDMLMVEAVAPSVRNNYADINPTNVNMINYPDPNDDGWLDDAYLRNYIQSNFSPSFSGIMVIDWEGVGMQRLFSNVGSPTQIQQIQEYVRAIQVIKSVCPNAKVGYYALPSRAYWNRNSTWQALNSSLAPIFEASDALFPSVYTFYKEGVDPTPAGENIAYIEDNMREALRLANGKPVYPFFWHRFHNANANFGMMSVPSSQFRAGLAAALNVSLSGKTIAGLVWWGADTYYASYAVAHSSPSDPAYTFSMMILNAYASEKLPGETDSVYINRIHDRVFGDFRATIRAAQGL